MTMAVMLVMLSMVVVFFSLINLFYSADIPICFPWILNLMGWSIILLISAGVLHQLGR